MSRKLVFLLATLLMISTSYRLAQVEQGAITGAVVDSTGASIPKAKVTATNQATGAIAVAETTDEGYYKLPYLPAGKYKLAVEKEGFVINRVTDVPVLVGQIATINVTLKPGSIHDEVTVTSNAVLVDQVSSSLGYVTGATQILELPTGRSPYSLMNALARRDRHRQQRDGSDRQRRPLQHLRHPAGWAGYPEQLDARQRLHTSPGNGSRGAVHHQQFLGRVRPLRRRRSGCRRQDRRQSGPRQRLRLSEE